MSEQHNDLPGQQQWQNGGVHPEDGFGKVHFQSVTYRHREWLEHRRRQVEKRQREHERVA